MFFEANASALPNTIQFTTINGIKIPNTLCKEYRLAFISWSIIVTKQAIITIYEGIRTFLGIYFATIDITKLEPVSTAVVASPIPTAFRALVVTAKVGHKPSICLKIALLLYNPFIIIFLIILTRTKPCLLFYNKFINDLLGRWCIYMKLYEDYEIQRKWNEAVEKCNNLLQELTDEEWYSYINEFLILDAHSSNAIEGNSYTLKETTNLIKYDETANNKTFKEASDIISYREASIYCLNYNGKINRNFLKELHYLVYGKARGSDDYKKRENWIGGKFITGREIKTASPEDVPLLMDNLLLFINDGIHKYINNFSNPKDLFYFLALTHARFESIHPFTDGNGRTGRLLNIAITQRLNFLPFYIGKNSLQP